MTAAARVVPVRVKTGAHSRRVRHPLPGHDREQDEDEADGRGLHHPTRPPEAHVEAHEHRDRDGHGEGEGAPRASP